MGRSAARWRALKSSSCILHRRQNGTQRRLVDFGVDADPRAIRQGDLEDAAAAWRFALLRAGRGRRDYFRSRRAVRRRQLQRRALEDRNGNEGDRLTVFGRAAGASRPAPVDPAVSSPPDPFENEVCVQAVSPRRLGDRGPRRESLPDNAAAILFAPELASESVDARNAASGNLVRRCSHRIWFILNLCCGAAHTGNMRTRRSSGPARPYLARLRVLRRLFCPSAWPLLPLFSDRVSHGVNIPVHCTREPPHCVEPRIVTDGRCATG